jgi:hypothetical protein
MRRTACLFLLPAACVLLFGCDQPLKAYRSPDDLAPIRQAAAVIAEGTVAAVDEGDHHPLPEKYWSLEGDIGYRCVVELKNTLKVTRAVKGVEAPADSLVFWYHAPCIQSLPLGNVEVTSHPLKPGDRVRVYLEKRGDKYWLIGHEKL